MHPMFIAAYRNRRENAKLKRENKDVKKQLIREIVAEIGLRNPASKPYRDTVFHFHTRRHYLGLNLMNLIQMVKKENNLRLAAFVDRIVGDFSYIPDANSYCIPMIRLQIQSKSVLMQPEDFAELFVSIEIDNRVTEQKVKQCCSAIQEHQVSEPLKALASKLLSSPDRGL